MFEAFGLGYCYRCSPLSALQLCGKIREDIYGETEMSGLSQTDTFRGEGLTFRVAFVFLQLKLTEENGPCGVGQQVRCLRT